jgi:hypothetical protein
MITDRTSKILAMLTAGLMLSVGLTVTIIVLPNIISTTFISLFMTAISIALIISTHIGRHLLPARKLLLLIHALSAVAVFILTRKYFPHRFFLVWCPIVFTVALVGWHTTFPTVKISPKKIAIPLLVGIPTWSIVFFMERTIHGPWFNESQIMVVPGAILAFGIPSLIHNMRSGSVTALVWTTAFVPILLLLGALSDILLRKLLLSAALVSHSASMVPLLALTIWSLLGFFIHRVLSAKNQNALVHSI